MDEINLFLLSLIIAILIRRIFETEMTPMDILWIPLLTFIIYWVLLRAYSQQNPSLRDLQWKLFQPMTEGFEDNKIVSMPQSLLALRKLKSVRTKNDFLLKDALPAFNKLYQEYETRDEPLKEEDVKESVQKLYDENDLGIETDEENQTIIFEVMEKILADKTPKTDDDILRFQWEVISKKMKNEAQPAKTAPNPLGYPTGPQKTTFAAVGEPKSTELPGSEETPAEKQEKEEKATIEKQEEGSGAGAVLANPVAQPTEAETRVIPVYGDANKNETFTNPLATFADEVLKSLPEPIQGGSNGNTFNFYMNDKDGKQHQPTPNPACSSSGTVDQNIYIFNDGFATSMKGQVAPMATSAVENGPLSADFNWALGQMVPVWKQQMENPEMRKNRRIMKTNGIPHTENENTNTDTDTNTNTDGIEFEKSKESSTIQGEGRNGATPEASRTFPRFDPVLLENKRCAFQPFYDTEAGGERVLKNNSWEGQFKGILPDAIFKRNLELAENPVGLKQKACFPSGVMQNRPWREWKEVEEACNME
jgi:hypothetical protein